MNTKINFRNAVYAAAFAATALFTVGCEDQMAEVQGPVDEMGSKNSGSTTQTAQSVTIKIEELKAFEAVEGSKLEFNFKTAASYYTAINKATGATYTNVAFLMEEAASGNSLNGGKSHEELKNMQCAFWWGDQLSSFDVAITEGEGKNKITTIYTLNPTEVNSTPAQGTAWDNAGNATTPGLSLKFNVAGQSIMIKDNLKKYSFTILDGTLTDGTPRVENLRIFLDKVGEDGVAIPSEQPYRVLTYKIDYFVKLASVDQTSDSYFDPSKFFYGFPGDGNIFGKSDIAKSFLLPTKDGESLSMTEILMSSDFNRKDNREAYVTSASAYVDVVKQSLEEVASGDYQARIEGTVKGNDASISTNTFKVRSGTFSIGSLKNCKR